MAEWREIVAEGDRASSLSGAGHPQAPSSSQAMVSPTATSAPAPATISTSVPAAIASS